MTEKISTKRKTRSVVSILLAFALVLASAGGVFADVGKVVTGKITESSSNISAVSVAKPNPDSTTLTVTVTMPIGQDANGNGLLDVGDPTPTTNDVKVTFDLNGNNTVDAGDFVWETTWSPSTNNVGTISTIPAGAKVNSLLTEGMKIWVNVSEDKNNFGYNAVAGETTVNYGAVITGAPLFIDAGQNPPALADLKGSGATATDVEDGNVLASVTQKANSIYNVKTGVTGATFATDGNGKLTASGPYFVTLTYTDTNNYKAEYRRMVVVQTYSDNNDDGDENDPEDKDYVYDPVSNGLLYAKSWAVAYANSNANLTVDSDVNKDEILSLSGATAWSTIDMTPVTVTRAHIQTTASYVKTVGTYKPITFNVPTSAFPLSPTPNLTHGSV